MKTNSRRDLTRRRAVFSICALAAVGVLLLFVIRGGVGGAASTLFSPLASVQHWLRTSSATLPMYLRTQQALIGEVRALEEMLAARERDSARTAYLQAENAQLREALVMPTQTHLLAHVLMRPPHIPYDSVLIDRGADDGIVEGAAVYADRDVAIGTVAAVYAQSAVVRLVSAPGTTATAYVFGPDIFTETEGMGGGVLRILVPQGIPLEVGDVVVLPAGGAGVYGEVAEVEALASSPYQYGYVTAPVSLSSLRTVRVAAEPLPTVSYESAREVIETASSTQFHVAVPDAVLIGTSTAPVEE